MLRIVLLLLALVAVPATVPVVMPAAATPCLDEALEVYDTVNKARSAAGLSTLTWSAKLAETARLHLPYVVCGSGWCAIEQTGNPHWWPDCRATQCAILKPQTLTGYQGRAAELLCGDVAGFWCGWKLLESTAHRQVMLEQASRTKYRAAGASCSRNINTGAYTVSIYLGTYPANDPVPRPFPPALPTLTPTVFRDQFESS